MNLRLLLALAVLAPSPSALAAPDAHPAGVQAAPPGPGAPSAAPLTPDERQRRAIRGCPLDRGCRDADYARHALREFERTAFPRDTSSPWIDADDPDGHARARAGLPGGGAAAAAARQRPARGTQLRPDLPWLDDLEMPDLPVVWDHRLIKYLEFYKDDPRGRNIMGAWLRAQGRFRDMILKELRRAGLPDDLLYVAMIESSYDPHEYSRAGASGLWQFMPAGGKIYGLHIDRWLDERNDPVRSTHAVMMYWADLYDRFGDWHLAMAAYNAGYGAVLQAIAKYNTNDFWQLLDYENALPWESSLYVPKALAAAIVGHNREIFGFGDVRSAEPFRFDTVEAPGGVRLATIARAAGVDTEAVEQLNPQLRKGRTPPGLDRYVLRIPRGTAGVFGERFAQLRGEWDGFDAYVVPHGQRFEDVATMHGISRRGLRELNGVEHESEVRGGTILVVPKISPEERDKNAAEAADNLYTAGEPEGEPGEPLIVAVPEKDTHVDGKQRVFYRVVTGDTQWGVSQAFGVDRRDLAAWNGLEPEAHLHPRMVLQVFVVPGFDPKAANVALLDATRVLVVTRGSDEHLDLMEHRTGRKRVVYEARKRETYREIGARYGLTARDMARINDKPFDTVLEPGETCIVYEVVDRSRSDRARSQAKKARGR